MLLILTEKILRSLSRTPEPDTGLQETKNVETELNQLRHALPEIDMLSTHKRVLDFGCGTGAHAVGLGIAGAAQVVGLDINTEFLQAATALASRHGVEERVSFRTEIDGRDGAFDLVLSYNSMEHFKDPIEALKTMKNHLRPEGKLLVAFSPPWLSAYGAHMHFFTSVPWVHLLFPESVVMTVRASYKNDGARRYEDVEGGLNRMTVSRFESLIEQAGLKVEWIRLTPMKQITIATRIPFLREFFTTRVSCCLSRM